MSTQATSDLAEPPPLPKPSAPARPKFGWEPPRKFLQDALDLLPQHMAEVDPGVPVDPDYACYLRWADQGILHVWTVRLEGELIGYIVALITTNTKWRTNVWSFCDLYWLAPEHRKGRLGLRMFRTYFKALRDSGVTGVQLKTRESPFGKRIANWFQRALRMKQTEAIYERRFK